MYTPCKETRHIMNAIRKLTNLYQQVLVWLQTEDQPMENCMVQYVLFIG